MTQAIPSRILTLPESAIHDARVALHHMAETHASETLAHVLRGNSMSAGICAKYAYHYTCAYESLVRADVAASWSAALSA